MVEWRSISLRGWILVLLCLLATTHADGATPDFAPGLPYSAGPIGGTRGIAVGDFNEDGFMDILTARTGGYAVSLLLNDRAGGFLAPIIIAGPFRDEAIVTGDFNGDGHLDFAIGSEISASMHLSIMLGDGHGGFSGSTAYRMRDTVAALAAADLNGDGNLDLVAFDEISGLTVFLGDGGGGFSALPARWVGGGILRIRSGEVNGDGKPDILLASAYGGVVVLAGDGTGALSLLVHFAVGLYGATDMAVGDMDGDGRLDIAVASSSLQVRYGAGDGTFPVGADYPISPSVGHVVSLEAVDVNRDGLMDVVGGSNSYTPGGFYPNVTRIHLSVLLSRPSRQASLSTFSAIRDGSTYYTNLAYGIGTADFDRDGLPDVAIADYSGPVWTFRNQTTPSASNDGPLCPGETLHLTATFGPGASYEWTGPNSFSSTLQDPTIPNVSAAEAGSYSVTATIGGWTSAPATTTVVVSGPLVTPTATNDGPRCEGDVLHLETAAVPGATYSWTGPNGFVSAERSPTLSPVTLATSGDYSVTVSLCGASAGGKTKVVVAPLPPPPQITAPESVQTGREYTASVPATMGATYDWSITYGTITSPRTGASITFRPGDRANLYLRVRETSQAGCTSPEANRSWQITPATGAFFVLTPCRQIDTRNVSTPALAAQEERGVSVTGGACGISPMAKALVLNVTVVAPAEAGFLALYPGGRARPTASSLNFGPGQVRANKAIVPIGAGGSLMIFNGAAGATNVVVDVVGYFQ